MKSISSVPAKSPHISPEIIYLIGHPTSELSNLELQMDVYKVLNLTLLVRPDKNLYVVIS